ncbi:MAG: DNA alkylation repair protein [Ferruginibacter sp.]
MHKYIKPIAALLEEYADKENAIGAKAYMRNQFEFFGLKAALRRSLIKEYLKEGLPHRDQLQKIITELWQLPQREFQYFGIALIAACKKQWDAGFIPLIEFMITHKSWWDSVDGITSEITGPFFTKYPALIKKTTGKWNTSENLWLQRSSLLFQLKYKQKTDIQLLSKYILRHTSSKEFFIQKAIGWVLREYSKTNPDWVIHFVGEHQLAALSKREALKYT